MGIKFFRWNHRSCFAILFLLVACVLSACASTKGWSSNQSSAVEAGLAGKSAEVRELLKLEQDDPFSYFLLSCIELSEGNLSLSRLYADKFIATSPLTPDGAVLVELIEERRAYPDEPWLTSFASAWKAAGSPN